MKKFLLIFIFCLITKAQNSSINVISSNDFKIFVDTRLGKSSDSVVSNAIVTIGTGTNLTYSTSIHVTGGSGTIPSISSTLWQDIGFWFMDSSTIVFTQGGISRYRFNNAGLIPNAGATYDLGSRGQSWRSGYFEGNGTTPSTNGLQINNLTAASVGTQRSSPALVMESQVWETTGPSSKSIRFRSYNRSVEATTPFANYTVDSSIDGGTFTNAFTYSTTGDLTLFRSLIISGITRAQRNALTPVNGQIIYQTDSTPGHRAYVNGAWYIMNITADP